MTSKTPAQTMIRGFAAARFPDRAASSSSSSSRRATVWMGAGLLGALLVALLGALLLSQGRSDQTIAPGRLAGGALGLARRPVELSGARRRALSAAYGRIPLSFDRNQGQSDRRVRFLSRGAGYALALTERGPVLSLSRREARGGAGAASAVGLRFLGRSDPALIASGRLPGRVNYLIGRDPQRWHTNVPTYSRVTYRAVWPGIDVTFYGNQRRLEYDLRLRPGADPARIALGVRGARDVRLDRGGDLVIGLRGGTVRELAPRAYQRIGGARAAVASRFMLLPGNRVAVRVGAYDHHRPLVIDPALIYSTFLGGSGVEYTNPGIAVDSSGSVYVTGPTTSTNFPTTPAAYQTTSGGGGFDGFVTKLNPTGTAFTYSTYLGGSGVDATNGVAVDSAGDAYVTGQTNSPNFPITPGAYQATEGGGYDAFVTELNPAGSGLVYSTYLGGNGDEVGLGVALDGTGSVYVTGSTASSNFPTTPGALQTTSGGGVDAFVAKLNPAATGAAQLVYSTYLGGSGDETSYGIAVDAAGSAYVAGQTNSTDFPTTPGAFQRTYGGGPNDVFAAKLNPAGSALDYSTYVGGSGNDIANGIAIDSTGSAYLVGSTSSTDFPTTPGAYQRTYGGGSSDGFVTKLNPAGSALSYSTYLGGSGEDSIGGVAVDGTGSAYLAGDTQSANFPITAGALQTTYAGGDEGLLIKLNPRGSALVYSTFLGNPTFDASRFDPASGIAVDGSGNAYVAGSTSSADFPTTPGAAQSTYGGSGDGYLLKLATPAVLRSTSTSVSCSPAAVRVGVATGCTAVVTDTDGGPVSVPSGVVSFASSQSGAFAPGAMCTLAGTATAGQASCQVSYTPSVVGSGTDTITASYGGDAEHAASEASTALVVTPVPPPGITVTTEPASHVTVTSAILHGVIGTSGVATSWQFQYGRTTRYGRGTPIEAIPAGKGVVAVSWTVRRLSPLARYHFLLVGITGSGGGLQTVYGRDLTFTTKATGRLLLDRARLLVRHGMVSALFTCSSSVLCASKLSITTRARLGKSKRLATVVCATTRRFFKIRAHKRLTVRMNVRSACLALLRKALRHRIGAKLTANPHTGQHAVIRKVLLVLQ